MNQVIPPAEVFQSYEKLGIIGILLLLMFVGLLVGKTVFGWIKEYGGKVMDQLIKQTLALENVKNSNASMEINQARLHERMDAVLRCPARPCPLRPSDHLPYFKPTPHSITD